MTAESDEFGTLSNYISPGHMISIALFLAALWVLLGMKQTATEVETVHESLPTTSYHDFENQGIDAWGRIIDD